MGKYQDLSEFVVPEGFRSKSLVYIQFWWIFQALFLQNSLQFMYGWRRFWFNRFGATIDDNVLIRPTANCVYPWNLTIGKNTWIGDNVNIYSLGKIDIGENAVISQNCYLCTGSHDFSKRDFPIFSIPIHIGNEVWLASDVFVAPGVKIGDGTVVGARSTVLHDLPGGMICYGNPAKPIKPRVMKNNETPSS